MTAEAVMAEAMAVKGVAEARVAVAAREAMVAGPSPADKAASKVAAVMAGGGAGRCTRCKCCRWSCSSCPS